MDKVIKLRELREKAGLTQEELAEKSGVSRTIISFIETGKERQMTSGTMKRIAEALDLTVPEVFYADQV